MKTLILLSSARKFGNTYQACQTYMSEQPADLLYLDDYIIHDYTYDHTHKDDDFRRLFTNTLKYDHIVIASPVYWYAVTPKMKAFIDRITEYMDDDDLQEQLRQFRRKSFSILTSSIKAQAPQAMIDMLLHTFNYLGMSHINNHHYQF